MNGTRPGILGDEDAQHFAACTNAKKRSVYAGKAEDCPRGAPGDAVYYRATRRTRSGRRAPRPPGAAPLGRGAGNLGAERGL